MRDDGAHLEHIKDSADLISEYLTGPTGSPERAKFDTDSLARDGVLRRLETLADAAGHLSAELRQRHPEVDWRRLTDFRNILAHAYTRLDYERIWRSITEDLPALQAVVVEELG